MKRENTTKVTGFAIVGCLLLLVLLFAEKSKLLEGTNEISRGKVFELDREEVTSDWEEIAYESMNPLDRFLYHIRWRTVGEKH